MSAAAQPNDRANNTSAVVSLNLPRAAMLIIGTEEEYGDLLAWADDHTEDPRTGAWLQALDPESYPCFAPIPLPLVNDVEALLAVWEEVLGAHKEEQFSSSIVFALQV